MRRTLYSHCLAHPAITLGSWEGNGIVRGFTVDLSLYSNDFRTVYFVVYAGSISDGSHVFSLEDSDNGSAWTAVAAARVQGTAPTLTGDTDNVVREFGYIVGTQRYVRARVDITECSSGANNYGCVAILSEASLSPVDRSS